MIKYKGLRWVGHVARMEEGSNAFNILTGKPIGKRYLGNPKRRWEDPKEESIRGIGLIRLRI